MPAPLDILELHAAHACNLTCESCSHYANQGLSGVLTPEEARRWTSAWKHRITPRRFHVMGGEPTIAPRLPEILVAVREAWPHCHLDLVTNGFFLYRHQSLPAVLKQTRCRLVLSEHSLDAAYQRAYRPGHLLAERWRDEHQIDLELRPSINIWTRRYQGYGPTMLPWQSSSARKSWEICPAKKCMQLHEGMLWKCPRVAYLALAEKAHGLSESWKPYLAYEALTPDVSDEELHAFLGRTHERVCTMCPDTTEKFVPASPVIPAKKLLRTAR